MGKHNYPKNRKKRNTSYSKTYKVLKQLGVDRVKEIFSQMGMYRAAKEISNIVKESVSPYVVRYLRRKINEKNSI